MRIFLQSNGKVKYMIQLMTRDGIRDTAGVFTQLASLEMEKMGEIKIIEKKLD